MIGDDQRGWAWTRALQGLPANEIHLCGDASALPLVKQMCEDMGEPLSVMNYDRFTDLEIQPGALPRDYTSVEPGDCIVAFSRRDIFDIKTDIERRTNHKCCVIYGALPPEMRRHQAALFNEPNNGFDILVASDAVGMGLNLNIRRVIFHKVQKFEGYNTIPVSTSQIKQIAGKSLSPCCPANTGATVLQIMLLQQHESLTIESLQVIWSLTQMCSDISYCMARSTPALKHTFQLLA